MDASTSDFDSQPEGDPSSSWTGYWRVRRYGGEDPSVPTFYDATEASWDVIKGGEEGLHVARHPILEIKRAADAKEDGRTEGDTLVLKDEGTADEAAETWHVEVEGDRLSVEAQAGPHEGAVGIAERIETDPRELISER